MFDKVRKIAQFLTEYYFDLTTYMRYCGISPLQNGVKRRTYKLMIEAHALEKGLSLENPRAFFGKERIAFLMRELALDDVSASVLPRAMVLGAFTAYAKVHRDRGLFDPILEDIDAFLAAQQAPETGVMLGGLRNLTHLAYDHTGRSPKEFIASRFSNRVMSSEALDRVEVEKVVALAQTAPSQCNRQSSHAHFYGRPTQVRALLDLQKGAAGFSGEVGNLFIVSSDIAAWGGAQQRNQPYVDGALFAMSLLYALHARGIAACPLNLAITHSVECKIKAAGAIPMDQRLIMMIAVGWPKDQAVIKAAASPRRPTSEVLHLH